MYKRMVQSVLFVAMIMLTFAGWSVAAVKVNEAYSRGTDADPDWVEIYNDSDAEVDLTGYKIYDNGGQSGGKPKMGFPAGAKLAAYGFYVIVTDNKADPANFGLGSGGDKVWLEDAAGAVIDSSVFGAMQPTESFQRIPDGGAWKMTSPITRGSSNLPVKMNEVFSQGTSASPDWIELYNTLNDTLDISGYKIYDNGGQSGSKPKMVFPAGTLIMPNGYLVVVTDDKANPANFGLSSNGEKVWLEDSTGAVIDSVQFSALQPTESYSRIPDGRIWQVVSTVTRGASNVGNTGVHTAGQVVEGFQLTQNYPNPFNPTTSIQFTLPYTTEVSVSVYSLTGQLVSELVNARQPAGVHQIEFNGAHLASGVYIYMIKTPEFTSFRRMVLMK